MKAAYLRARVERNGDEVVVRMNDATACALSDYLIGQKEVEHEFGTTMVNIYPPGEWSELAAELRTVK